MPEQTIKVLDSRIAICMKPLILAATKTNYRSPEADELYAIMVQTEQERRLLLLKQAKN